MPNISEYTDFRKFLRDYYEEARAKNPNYSYQVFCSKAGLKSKGFLHNVINGKRSISLANVFGISQAMRLDKYEMEYFENLVEFNQARSDRERTHFFERLSAVKNSGPRAWKPQIVRNEQYQFYSHLHHSVVRSLIGMYGFKDDYKWLAGRVSPSITPGQAKKSIELLLRLGFIKKQHDESYVLADATISTPPEVLNLAVHNFHQESGGLALKALSETPGNRRNITGITIGISRESYKVICEEVKAFRARILQLAESDRNAEDVYQLNFQLFPVSKVTPKENNT